MMDYTNRKDIAILHDFAHQFSARLNRFWNKHLLMENDLFFLEDVRYTLEFIDKTHRLMLESDEMWTERLMLDVYFLTTWQGFWQELPEGWTEEDQIDCNWITEIGYFLYHEVDDYYKEVDMCGGIEGFKELYWKNQEAWKKHDEEKGIARKPSRFF